MASQEPATTSTSSMPPEADDEANAGYFFNPTQTINVLLIGRSQTGKSAILDVLKKPRVHKEKQGFSKTREPERHVMTLLDKPNNKIYQVNIIDTPGLQEVTNDPRKDRTDQELLTLVRKCIEENWTELNCVCLVSRAGETHQHDLDTFEPLIKFLGPEYSANTMMLLTHCDQYPSRILEKFQTEIKSHPKSKETLEYCKLGLFYHGLVNYDQIDAQLEDNPDPVLRQQNIDNLVKRLIPMRRNLVQAVIRTASSPRKVKQLQEVINAYNAKQNAAKQQFWYEYQRQQKPFCPVM